MSKNPGRIWYLNAEIVARRDGTLILIGREIFRIYPANSTLHGVLRHLSRGINEAEYSSIKAVTSANRLFTELEKRGLMTSMLSKTDNPTLEKSAIFYSRMQRKRADTIEHLGMKTVTILGCGGVGAGVALHLCGAGIRNFNLLDYDDISVSNLNRQYPYRPDQIGQPKTEVLAHHLNALSADGVISTEQVRVTSRDNLQKISDQPCDLIVGALDTPPLEIRLAMLDIAIEKNLPIIFGAAGYADVTVGPLLTSQSAMKSYRTHLVNQISGVDLLSLAPVQGSLPGINSMVTSMIANIAISFLAELSLSNVMNEEILLDAWNFEIKARRTYD